MFSRVLAYNMSKAALDQMTRYSPSPVTMSCPTYPWRESVCLRCHTLTTLWNTAIGVLNVLPYLPMATVSVCGEHNHRFLRPDVRILQVCGPGAGSKEDPGELCQPRGDSDGTTEDVTILVISLYPLLLLEEAWTQRNTPSSWFTPRPLTPWAGSARLRRSD